MSLKTPNNLQITNMSQMRRSRLRRTNNSPKITHLVSDAAEIWTQAWGLQRSVPTTTLQDLSTHQICTCWWRGSLCFPQIARIWLVCKNSQQDGLIHTPWLSVAISYHQAGSPHCWNLKGNPQHGVWAKELGNTFPGNRWQGLSKLKTQLPSSRLLPHPCCLPYVSGSHSRLGRSFRVVQP